jgi:hypothetical protein
MRSFVLIFAAALIVTPALAADRIDAAFQIDAQARAKELEAQARQAKIEKVSAPVRTLIERQIEAVKQDDAQTAFQAIAPKLKQKFANGDTYLKVVRAQFPALAEARIVDFGDMRDTSYGKAQMVRLSDSKGEPWLAFFIMDKAGKDWRIANVVMVKLPSVEA